MQADVRSYANVHPDAIRGIEPGGVSAKATVEKGAVVGTVERGAFVGVERQGVNFNVFTGVNSPTFYTRLFRMKVLRKAFCVLTFKV
jgi:hypothetical protein